MTISHTRTIMNMMFTNEYGAKVGPAYTRRATQRHTSDKSLRHIGGEAI